MYRAVTSTERRPQNEPRIQSKKSRESSKHIIVIFEAVANGHSFLQRICVRHGRFSKDYTYFYSIKRPVLYVDTWYHSLSLYVRVAKYQKQKCIFFPNAKIVSLLSSCHIS